MKGVFEILVDGKLETYYNYNDIPEVFDNVIKFLPDVPPGPHSEDQHKELEKWVDRLRYLMEKERERNG
jgi:hypothetical protein